MKKKVASYTLVCHYSSFNSRLYSENKLGFLSERGNTLFIESRRCVKSTGCISYYRKRDCGRLAARRQTYWCAQILYRYNFHKLYRYRRHYSELSG